MKIDKESIADLIGDPDEEAITSTIVTLAHSPGLTVVAEGVAARAQMRFLHHHGCDETQDLLLARPMQAGRCLALRGAWSPAAGPAAAARTVDVG